MLIIKTITIFLLLILQSFSAFASKKRSLRKSSNFVIYGEDNRQDLYKVSDTKIKKISQSVVSLIPFFNIEKLDSNSSQIHGINYGEHYALCSSERFFKQQTSSDCSGVLVAENKVLTAGHCADFCQTNAIVFGFANHSSQQKEHKIKNSEIYSCQRVLTKFHEPFGKDFAIMELDRKVKGHQPLKLNPKKTESKSHLITIGHPSGLPLKITDDGSLRSNSSEYFFIADLDTYSGNSGSPVINLKTQMVEGILARGEQDFTLNKDDCFVSYRCKKGDCRGEDVIRSSVILDYL